MQKRGVRAERLDGSKGHPDGNCRLSSQQRRSSRRLLRQSRGAMLWQRRGQGAAPAAICRVRFECRLSGGNHVRGIGRLLRTARVRRRQPMRNRQRLCVRVTVSRIRDIVFECSFVQPVCAGAVSIRRRLQRILVRPERGSMHRQSSRPVLSFGTRRVHAALRLRRSRTCLRVRWFGIPLALRRLPSNVWTLKLDASA
jgi:hypothetical protein